MHRADYIILAEQQHKYKSAVSKTEIKLR